MRSPAAFDEVARGDRCKSSIAQRDGEADRRDASLEPGVPASKRDRDERDGRDANGGLLEDGSEQVEDQMLRAALSALPDGYLENQPAPSSDVGGGQLSAHGPR